MKIIIIKNNLYNEYVEAIVNFVNEQLEHAVGTAFDIRLAGGGINNEESRTYIREYRGLPTN